MRTPNSEEEAKRLSRKAEGFLKQMKTVIGDSDTNPEEHPDLGDFEKDHTIELER